MRWLILRNITGEASYGKCSCSSDVLNNKYMCFYMLWNCFSSLYEELKSFKNNNKKKKKKKEEEEEEEEENKM